jgi:hypothetical protein
MKKPDTYRHFFHRTQSFRSLLQIGIHEVYSAWYVFLHLDRYQSNFLRKILSPAQYLNGKMSSFRSPCPLCDAGLSQEENAFWSPARVIVCPSRAVGILTAGISVITDQIPADNAGIL